MSTNGILESRVRQNFIYNTYEINQNIDYRIDKINKNNNIIDKQFFLKIKTIYLDKNENSEYLLLDIIQTKKDDNSDICRFILFKIELNTISTTTKKRKTNNTSKYINKYSNYNFFDYNCEESKIKYDTTIIDQFYSEYNKIKATTVNILDLDDASLLETYITPLIQTSQYKTLQNSSILSAPPSTPVPISAPPSTAVPISAPPSTVVPISAQPSTPVAASVFSPSEELQLLGIIKLIYT